MSIVRGREQRMLAELHPRLAENVSFLLMMARGRGLPVGLFSGLRSFEEQATLYAKGRNVHGNIIDSNAIVTRAGPGMSYHNYGLAVDIVFDDNPRKAGYQWTWDEAQPWAKLAELGRDECGLEPGFFWEFTDPPHFQLSGIPPATELLKLYENGGMKAVWNVIRA